MSYSRRIVHLSPGPEDLVGVLEDRAVAGCWFALDRRGGCGAGELRLADAFADRGTIDVGDWIACEPEEGTRWYLGRVARRRSVSPGGVVLELEGIGSALAETYVGGYSTAVGDGAGPLRFGASDPFADDPDRADEASSSTSDVSELVAELVESHLAPRTHVLFDPDAIEGGDPPATVESLKLRGEDSLRSVFADLALRDGNASFGVEADRTFFFRPRPVGTAATFREGLDVVRLEEVRDLDRLANRLTLTGDIVYGAAEGEGLAPRGTYRWRGHYEQPDSRAAYGDRPLHLQVGWIRTSDDAEAFAREFFRVHAVPRTVWRVEALLSEGALPKPWEGRIRILAADGSELTVGVPESLRVDFDHVPRLRFELGPPDPRHVWSPAREEDRWEIPGAAEPAFGGASITYPGTFPYSLDGAEPILLDTFADADETPLFDHVPDIDVAGHGWGDQWDFYGSTVADGLRVQADGPGGENGLVSIVTFPDVMSTVDTETTDGLVRLRANVGSAPATYENVWIGVVFRREAGETLRFWRAVYESLTPAVRLEEWDGELGGIWRDAIFAGADWPSGAGYEVVITVRMDGAEIRADFDLGGFAKSLSYSSSAHLGATEHGCSLYAESRPVRPFATELAVYGPLDG